MPQKAKSGSRALKKGGGTPGFRAPPIQAGASRRGLLLWHSSRLHFNCTSSSLHPGPEITLTLVQLGSPTQAQTQEHPEPNACTLFPASSGKPKSPIALNPAANPKTGNS